MSLSSTSEMKQHMKEQFPQYSQRGTRVGVGGPRTNSLQTSWVNIQGDVSLSPLNSVFARKQRTQKSGVPTDTVFCSQRKQIRVVARKKEKMPKMKRVQTCITNQFTRLGTRNPKETEHKIRQDITGPRDHPQELRTKVSL